MVVEVDLGRGEVVVRGVRKWMGKIVCAKTLRIKRGPEKLALSLFGCSVAKCNDGKLSERAGDSYEKGE